MKITVIAVGKWKQSPEKDLFDTYTKRCGWHVSLIEVEEKRPLSGGELKEKEADLLLNAVPDGATLVALDERGKNITSPQFAKKISDWQVDGLSHIAFIIGGADGLAERVRQQSQFLLSFGALTWPHMLVRALLAEQIYRCEKIIQGHPYHKV